MFSYLHLDTCSRSAGAWKALVVASTFIAAMIASQSSWAQIYKWTDEEGNTVYSDTPQEGAEEVKLEELTVMPAQPAAPRRRMETATETAVGDVSYASVSITSPADEETLRNITDVPVSVAIEPALKAGEGHRLTLFYDGAPYEKRTTSLQFTLREVERGQHTLSAAVIDADGRQLLGSETIKFFVHKNSVAQKRPAPR